MRYSGDSFGFDIMVDDAQNLVAVTAGIGFSGLTKWSTVRAHPLFSSQLGLFRVRKNGWWWVYKIYLFHPEMFFGRCTVVDGTRKILVTAETPSFPSPESPQTETANIDLADDGHAYRPLRRLRRACGSVPVQRRFSYWKYVYPVLNSPVSHVFPNTQRPPLSKTKPETKNKKKK